MRATKYLIAVLLKTMIGVYLCNLKPNTNIQNDYAGLNLAINISYATQNVF